MPRYRLTILDRAIQHDTMEEDMIYVIMKYRPIFKPGDDFYIRDLDTGEGRAYRVVGRKILSLKYLESLDKIGQDVIK